MDVSFQRSTASDEWYTPPHIIQALGEFDLDPCAAHGIITARNHLYKNDDGLSKEWHGRVWLNPPYSRKLICAFIEKMARHNNGIALIFNRMDIALWHETIFQTADSMLVLRGRLKFYRPDGSQGDSAGCGSVLLAWGEDNSRILQNCGLPGVFIKLRQ